MPGVVLHTLFATSALDRWRRDSFNLFDLDHPSLVAAYIRGSIAPDMGYFPGGDTRISTVAHGTRAAQIAWELVRTAKDDLEMAYACGWLTHVVADAYLHPHIEGASIWQSAYADPREGAADGLRAHLRLELGLDVHFLVGRERMVRDSWRRSVTKHSGAHVARALESASGVEFSVADVRRSDLALGRFVTVFVPYAILLAAIRRRFGPAASNEIHADPGEIGTRNRWRASAGLDNLAAPLRPTAALLSTASDLLETFPDRLTHHLGPLLAGAIPIDSPALQSDYDELGAPPTTDRRGGPPRVAA